IYEVEIKSSSSTSHNTQNIAFVSSQNTDSTNELDSVVASVFAASTKSSASILPNVDNLSDAEIDLKWQMAMQTIRVRRFLQRTGRNLGANGTTSIWFDMSKVKCYNYHRRGHLARECRSPKDTKTKDIQRRSIPVETSTSNALVSQYDGVGSYDWSFQADEEPINNALMAFTSSSSISSSGSDSELFINRMKNVFEEDIKLLKLNVRLRDNALVELRKKFEKAKKERGYANQVFNSTVFDSDELTSSESDFSVPTSLVHDSLYDAPIASETIPNVSNVEPNTTKPNKDLSQSHRPSAPIIED
nr:hypothetical protein [Tanacetum cinerariifolium]